ncbi:MAG: polymer-forming cytoskeletal protein [Pseudomonadota bacterium]
MFSKSKSNEPTTSADPSKPPVPVSAAPKAPGAPPPPTPGGEKAAAPAFPAKPKPSPSLLSNDLTIKGNVVTSGDIQIEGEIEGDVRAHLLTVGESATIRGEITADDVVVNGRVIGRVRGLKVRLTTTAQVEGDIVHKTIAIESGAHFEGSVQRQDDPLSDANVPPRKAAAPVTKVTEKAAE